MHKHLLPHIKMGKEILTFGGIEIEKYIFYRYKCIINCTFFSICIAHWYLARFPLVKKAVNILLFTGMMILKLSHCM